MRVVGTQHTFNDIADTDGIHLSLAKFNRMEITEDMKSVVIGAGTTYSHLIKLLARNKVALQNMPSAPHINIVGSLITGTHGGGFELPIISHYAEGFRYMNPRGEM